jgi:hypothetical protein
MFVEDVPSEKKEETVKFFFFNSRRSLDMYTNRDSTNSQ